MTIAHLNVVNPLLWTWCWLNASAETKTNNFLPLLWQPVLSWRHWQTITSLDDGWSVGRSGLFFSFFFFPQTLNVLGLEERRKWYSHVFVSVDEILVASYRRNGEGNACDGNDNIFTRGSRVIIRHKSRKQRDVDLNWSLWVEIRYGN